jgi:hypothetical protein
MAKAPMMFFGQYLLSLLMPPKFLFRKIYSDRVEIDQPERIATPYGGRLIWTMPGENKIIAHLKDSAKIRHKKRWSQVGCLVCWVFECFIGSCQIQHFLLFVQNNLSGTLNSPQRAIRHCTLHNI